MATSESSKAKSKSKSRQTKRATIAVDDIVGALDQGGNVQLESTGDADHL